MGPTIRKRIDETQTTRYGLNYVRYLGSVDELLPFDSRFSIVVYFVKPLAAHFVELHTQTSFKTCKMRENYQTYSNKGIVFDRSRIVDVVFVLTKHSFREMFAAILCSAGSCKAKL